MLASEMTAYGLDMDDCRPTKQGGLCNKTSSFRRHGIRSFPEQVKHE